MRVLLIDDSSTMRKIQKRALGEIGITDIEEAENGLVGLEKLKADGFNYSFVMLDMNMPEMSGTELVKEVRKLPECENTKIIMVSTESSQELIDGVMADGANGFITKPFTPEKFQEKLSPFMN